MKASGLGSKKFGNPETTVERLAMRPPTPGRPARKSVGLASETRFQNSSMRASRSATGLPAMSAALMAPIEVPITQSGSIPASCRAS